MSNEFAGKGYNAALVDLFNALQRRKYGQSGNIGKTFSPIEMMRQLTEWTGAIYKPQTETIKRNAILIGESAVTITIDTEHRAICFMFEEAGALSPEAKLDKLRQIVFVALGSGWEVSSTIVGKKSGKTKPRTKTRPSK